MKKNSSFILICICIILFVAEEASSHHIYHVEIDTATVTLNELKVNDTLFMNGIDSLVLRCELNEKTQKDYIYALGLDNDTINEVNVNIEFVPRYLMASSDVSGYFIKNNSIFIVRGAKFDPFFSFTGKKNNFIYTTEWVNIKDKRFRWDTMKTEEFVTWRLYYSSGKMELKNKMFLPGN